MRLLGTTTLYNLCRGVRYQGVLCGVCNDDWEFSAGTCTKCPESGGLPWLGYLVIGIVIFGVLIAIVANLVVADGDEKKQQRLRELFDIIDFGDGDKDEAVEKPYIRWAVERAEIPEDIEVARQNLLRSIDMIPTNEISFELFSELLTKGDRPYCRPCSECVGIGTSDTYVPSDAHSCGAQEKVYLI